LFFLGKTDYRLWTVHCEQVLQDLVFCTRFYNPIFRHFLFVIGGHKIGTVKRGNIGVFFVENLKSLEICYTWPQNFFWPWGALWWGLNGGKAFLGLCHHLDPNFFIFLRLPMFCPRQKHRHMVIFFLTKDDLIPPLVTSAYWECFKKIVEIRTKR